MDTQALITAGEAVFATVSGKALSAKITANIADSGSLVALALTLVERNTEFNVSGVVAGVTQILSGVNTTIQAAKTKAVNATVPASGV